MYSKWANLVVVAAVAIVLAGCSDEEAGGPQANNVQAPASVDNANANMGNSEKFAETEVIEIVNVVIDKDVEKVRKLLQANPKLVKAKITSGGPVDGWPLLMIAARQGDKQMVELLLSSGADPNEKNYSSEVPLHYAAHGGHKEIVELLLANHADVTVKNDAGATALNAASSSGKEDVAELLRQHGAKE